MQGNIIVKQIVNFAHLYLPGFDYGFGWVLPALCGFLIGLMIKSIGVKRHNSSSF